MCDVGADQLAAHGRDRERQGPGCGPGAGPSGPRPARPPSSRQGPPPGRTGEEVRAQLHGAARGTLAAPPGGRQVGPAEAPLPRRFGLLTGLRSASPTPAVLARGAPPGTPTARAWAACHARPGASLRSYTLPGALPRPP